MDQSHKRAQKKNPNGGKFGSDFISANSMAERDQFDLINAKKNYMDFNVGEEEDDDLPGTDDFFNNQQKMAEDDVRQRRTNAFNEVDDNIDFNEFANNDQCGEIGQNGQIIKEDSEADEGED